MEVLRRGKDKDRRNPDMAYGVKRARSLSLGSKELAWMALSTPSQYETARQFFEHAVEQLGYGPDELKYLVEPTSVVEDTFRVKAEEAGEAAKSRRVLGREITCWRDRFNPAGRPGKGGTRVTYPLRESDIRALAMDMNPKLKVMAMHAFEGGKGGFECEDWGDLTTDEKQVYMRSYARALKWCIGPLVDVPAGDMGTNDSALMWSVADECRRMVQDYAKALLKKTDIWRADCCFKPEDAERFLTENYGVDVARGGNVLLERIVWDDELAYSIAAPVITLKPVDRGGLAVREEATGRGVAICVMEAAKESYLGGTWTLSEKVTPEEGGLLGAHRDSGFLGRNTWEFSDEERSVMERLYGILLKGKRVSLQGLGASGRWAALYLAEKGCDIVCVSDTSAVLVDEEGLPFDNVLAYKMEVGSLSGFDSAGQCEKREPNRGEEFRVQADIYLPAAGGGQIKAAEAQAIQAMVSSGSDIILAEPANNPTTREADAIFIENAKPDEPSVRRIPDILANALGVTASISECAQNYITLLNKEISGTQRLPLTDEYRNHIERTFRCLDPSGRILHEKAMNLTDDQWRRILDDRMRCAYADAREMADERGVDLATGTWLLAVKRIIESIPVQAK